VAIQNSSPSCQPFSATFLAVADQTFDSPDGFLVEDPELIFFRETMKFRDDYIKHTTSDALKFFNESYGLDFSLSGPNEQSEYFYENARLSHIKFADGIRFSVILNNWIQSGSTRSTCNLIRAGGFMVTFTGDQVLHGSYGGADARVGENLGYGFHNIDVCQQSPIIFQYQSATPVRQEPVDGAFFFNVDLYSRVLGYGKAEAVFSVKQDPENHSQYNLVIRQVFTFPAT
jgi:hypothetical protein